MALQGERKAATVTQWEAGGIWLPPNAAGLSPISWIQAWSQLPKSRCCFLCSLRELRSAQQRLPTLEGLRMLMPGIPEVGGQTGTKGREEGKQEKKNQGGGSYMQPACNQHTRCYGSLPPPFSLPRNVPPPPPCSHPFPFCFLPPAETSSDLAEEPSRCLQATRSQVLFRPSTENNYRPRRVV